MQMNIQTKIFIFALTMFLTLPRLYAQSAISHHHEQHAQAQSSTVATDSDSAADCPCTDCDCAKGDCHDCDCDACDCPSCPCPDCDCAEGDCSDCRCPSCHAHNSEEQQQGNVQGHHCDECQHDSADLDSEKE